MCGEAASTNAPDFPYMYELQSRTAATLGPMDLGKNFRVYGYDSEHDDIVDPFNEFELMSYCRPRRWASKPTYEAILDAIATRWGVPDAPRILGLGPEVPHLVLRGTIDLTHKSAALFPVRTVHRSDPLVMPGPGPYRLELFGLGGNVAASYEFAAPLDTDSAEGDSASFTFIVPVPASFAGTTRAACFPRPK